MLYWFTGGVPSARWIVNFDLDFIDGLVLAALLAAYCPYLVSLGACSSEYLYFVWTLFSV